MRSLIAIARGHSMRYARLTMASIVHGAEIAVGMDAVCHDIEAMISQQSSSPLAAIWHIMLLAIKVAAVADTIKRLREETGKMPAKRRTTSASLELKLQVQQCPNTAHGVCQERRLRGRWFKFHTASATTLSRMVSNRVPFGKNSLRSPIVFSHVPRSSG